MSITLPNERMLIVALGLCLSVLGIFALLSGTSQRRPMGAIDTDRLAAIASNTDRPGLSTASQLGFLFECRRAMTSIVGRAQPSSLRDEVSRSCLNSALEMTTRSPTFSVAWLTAAVAAVQLRDWPAFERSIEKSYITGANEQWVAELRVDLVSDHRDRLDEALLSAHRADLILLLSHDRGRQFLADRYVALTAFRDEIDTILPSLDESVSRRFLNLAERREVRRQRQIDAQTR